MSVIIIAIGSVLYAVFERPFMPRDWLQKFQAWIRRRTSAST
jgi:peptidoglycan/LPS O-acetylase OafA/YrhL